MVLLILLYRLYRNKEAEKETRLQATEGSKTLYRNHTGAPKTDNSNQAITMPPAIMAEIKEYANKIYGIQPQDRVFAFSKESLRRNMIRYCKLSDIPRIRIYDIRHSHATIFDHFVDSSQYSFTITLRIFCNIFTSYGT